MTERSDEILTAQEVAERLNLPLATILLFARRGELPGARKLGKQYRIHWQTLVDAWFKSSSSATVPEADGDTRP